ncbi:helix-turn-helix transcriptional regulator [Pseudomonas bohemica]|uniref:helix-turn-helix transcriptional regulator n=1 Tax=Pseudomonas bohemica TaxID=2044872 RepID=UPI000DA5F27B|nr:WYL domain-containing protein [Pseudomonas bohemica]
MIKEPVPRSELLKTLLLWGGRLGNARLRELLGMKVTRVSQLMSEFQSEHPTWVEWDSVARSYRATPAAYRTKIDTCSSLGRYLSLVGISHAQSESTRHRMIWSAFPDISTPVPRVFAQISEAIELSKRIQINYRSISNPEPHRREISPHSIVRAGRRWHVRAFCSNRQEFRDFALGRIDSPKLLPLSAAKPADDDSAWNTQIQVRLIAHPKLNLAQQDMIRFEYFSGAAARVERCRAAMVSYFIQDVRAATDLSKHSPPEYQLAIENMEELRPWMFTT